MQLRAGIFSASHLAGGLEVRLQEEAAVLEDLGLSSSWFCPPFAGKDQLRAGFEQHRCEMVDLDLADPFRSWRFRLLLMKFLEFQGRQLRRRHLDFAHVALSWTNAGLAQALACSAAGVPFVVAVLVYLSSPSYIMPLFTTSTGHLLLGIAGVWMAMGIFVMKKMMNFEV